MLLMATCSSPRRSCNLWAANVIHPDFDEILGSWSHQSLFSANLVLIALLAASKCRHSTIICLELGNSLIPQRWHLGCCTCLRLVAVDIAPALKMVTMLRCSLDRFFQKLFHGFVDEASRSTLPMSSVSSRVLAACARALALATILRACSAFGWSDQRNLPRPKARLTFSSASSLLRLKRTPLSDLYSMNSKPSSLKKFLKLCSRKLLH